MNSRPSSKSILLRVQSGELSPEAGWSLIQQARRVELGGVPENGPGCESDGLRPAEMAPKAEPFPHRAEQAGERATTNRDIAVTGLSGQFPDAADLHQFWDNLLAGRDSVRDIPPERWDLNRYYNPDPGARGTTCCRSGGVLAGIDLFDAAFFNISPVEAERMDPQQRLLLTEAWKALEDAGYSEAGLKGRACAFFLGCQEGDYKDLVERRRSPNVYSLLGSLNSTLAARIAYYLNLKGPAVSIDTACSSSLVAIHLACDAIRSGQCEIALAGGVAVLTTPKFHVLGSQAGMLSSAGKCRTFDAAADGFAPGEGVAVAVLKPVAAALRDRDRIYGVIKGSGLNQDGKSNGLTAPNGPSQTALEAGVYRALGIDPRTIQYIECHGTATRLGDPIEINALTDAFAQFTPDKQFCGIGSAKSNIGHALAAAGMAGFIKTLFCLKESRLVPSLHFNRPNEALRIDSSPFYVVKRPAPWPAAPHGRRRAAVSAFGLSGTNCHMVLEEAPSAPRLSGRAPVPDGWFLVPLSAKTESSLNQKVADLQSWLALHPDETLSDICYTLLCRRSHFSYRICWLARQLEDLKPMLSLGLREGGVLANSFSHLEENLKTPPPASVRAGNTLIGQISARPGGSAALELESARHLAQHYVEGCELDWAPLFPSARLTAEPLPAYPFDRLRFWVDEPRPEPGACELPEPRKRKELLLRKCWKPAPLPDLRNGPPMEPKCVLVLASPSTLELARSFSGMFQHCRILRLDETAVNIPASGMDLAMNPFDPTAARPVIERVLREEARFDVLLDLSDLVATEPGSAFRVPIGKFLLLQLLIPSPVDETLAILHFTRGLNSVDGSAPDGLQGAVTAGLVKTLGAEYQRLRAVTIDLDRSGVSFESMAPVVMAECCSNGGPGEIAYRSGMRHAPALEPVELLSQALARATFRARLHPDKFYVVTGGTRGIGFEVARHFVECGARKLVLMGRQPLPPREQWTELLDRADQTLSVEVRNKIVRFRELESHGVELRVFTGSLTDGDALRQFLAPLREVWGEVGGVVHCAGLASDENPSFIHKSPESVERILEPKVAAMAVLDRFISEEKPDFFVLFSSVSSLAPRLGVGFSDYAAANSFLNYYAALRAHSRPGVFQSLMWPGWGETGMGEVKSPVYLSMGLLAHTTKEGLALFDQALRLPSCACLMPGVVNPDLFDAEALVQVRGAPKSRGPAQSGDARFISTETAAPGVLLALRAIFSEELKLPVEKLGLDTHFERLGVDSILLAEFTKRIERWLEIRLDPSCFLENATLRALAGFLAKTFPAQILRASISGTAGSPPTGESCAPPDPEPPVGSPASAPRSEADRGCGLSGRMAVIGMACHFPDAPDLDAFWANLSAGRCSIREVPSSRWDTGRLYSPRFEPGKSVSKWGGFIEGIEDFDPEFFRINPGVAAHLDPAVRQFLEVSLQCVRDSGHEDAVLDGRRVGVFVGSRMSQYSARILRPVKESVIGIAQNFIGAHISHFFNFTGPNLLIDTACSSSMVGIHQACQSLRVGECELALAGGVDILLDEAIYLRLSEGQALSPDGRCHTFDEKANGFVPGEGCGAVLLKPLSRALQDGDRIYAVVESSAVNNDGRTMGMTTPNPEAQQAVVREALRQAGLTADSLSYIEAHGTGTMIGDPIELRALNRVFRESTQATGFCAVGSVKTNIGHLLSAAGVASFIKVALSLQRRQLPPTLNCSQPNQRFDFPQSPFYPALRLQDWTPRHGIRCAGISSFGFGGTNAHVILRGLTEAESALVPTPRKPLPPAQFNRRRYWMEKLPPAAPSAPPLTPGQTETPVRGPGGGNGNGFHADGSLRRPLLELELIDETESQP